MRYYLVYDKYASSKDENVEAKLVSLAGDKGGCGSYNNGNNPGIPQYHQPGNNPPPFGLLNTDSASFVVNRVPVKAYSS